MTRQAYFDNANRYCRTLQLIDRLQTVQNSPVSGFEYLVTLWMRHQQQAQKRRSSLARKKWFRTTES